MEIYLFGSYLKNKESARDIDIAVITDWFEGGSVFGRFLGSFMSEIFSTFSPKPVDLAFYSHGFLNRRHEDEMKNGQRRHGLYLKDSIFSGRRII